MVYAGMDPKTRLETHLGDLLDLEPTEAETQAAVDWFEPEDEPEFSPQTQRCPGPYQP